MTHCGNPYHQPVEGDDNDDSGFWTQLVEEDYRMGQRPGAADTPIWVWSVVWGV